MIPDVGVLRGIWPAFQVLSSFITKVSLRPCYPSTNSWHWILIINIRTLSHVRHVLYRWRQRRSEKLISVTMLSSHKLHFLNKNIKIKFDTVQMAQNLLILSHTNSKISHLFDSILLSQNWGSLLKLFTGTFLPNVEHFKWKLFDFILFYFIYFCDAGNQT